MITSPRWQALRRGAFRRSGGRCQCYGDCGGHEGQCPATLTLETMHGDHILPRHPRDPRIAPGPDVPANVRALCARCNMVKSNRITTLPEGPYRRAVLQTLHVWARVLRVGTVTSPLPPTIAPHVVTLRLQPAIGHAHIDVKALAEARAAAKHPRARVYTYGDELRVEIPRSPRRDVPLASMPRQGLRFGVGVDAENRVAMVDLGASPHMLIAGATQSGKSTMLQVIVFQLHTVGAELVLIDADGETFEPFARAARLRCAIARDVDAARDAVLYARQLMDARPIDPRQRPLVVAVDEVHMLDAATRDVIIDIAKRGRKRAVQLVVATHRPTRDYLPKVLTDQLTWSIAGKVKDSAGSRVIIDQTGAQWLAGKGDMILVGGGRAVRIQAALGGPADWAMLAKLEAEPAAAPVSVVTDTRNVRKPDDEAVRWAVERAVSEGLPPSATAIQREFGGAMDAARRRRDAALQALAVA